MNQCYGEMEHWTYAQWLEYYSETLPKWSQIIESEERAIRMARQLYNEAEDDRTKRQMLSHIRKSEQNLKIYVANHPEVVRKTQILREMLDEIR